MIILLIAIVITFFVTITILYIGYNKQKRTFRKRTASLENSIAVLGKQQEKQVNQLKLSDVLSEQLKESNHHLNKIIYDVNFQLFLAMFNKKKN
ncbi:hypothetical protein [Flavobacterium hydrophilum]|uniref:Uncharacterized protein n=1 Tax=Flavobacterium hydrophilum TaxID=2211445 RepID=A0A2V4CAZ6_9FLAO|nr:hypothetical protein [Flavobacterium hydrophilum]PXY47130.1 hypothetical protein DMB68_08280 [Flavobacterium hydrophilum]